MEKLSAATEQYRKDPVAETNQENIFFTGSNRLTSRENGGGWNDSSGRKRTKTDQRTGLQLTEPNMHGQEKSFAGANWTKKITRVGMKLAAPAHKKGARAWLEKTKATGSNPNQNQNQQRGTTHNKNWFFHWE
jgi:hypothetical protein